MLIFMVICCGRKVVLSEFYTTQTNVRSNRPAVGGQVPACSTGTPAPACGAGRACMTRERESGGLVERRAMRMHAWGPQPSLVAERRELTWGLPCVRGPGLLGVCARVFLFFKKNILLLCLLF
jgi:hypothetical protein